MSNEQVGLYCFLAGIFLSPLLQRYFSDDGRDEVSLKDQSHPLPEKQGKAKKSCERNQFNSAPAITSKSSETVVKAKDYLSGASRPGRKLAKTTLKVCISYPPFLFTFVACEYLLYIVLLWSISIL